MTQRSAGQNRLLWKLYGDVLAGAQENARLVGEPCPWTSRDDVHAAMKSLMVKASKGKRRSTAQLSVTQFNTLVLSICAWAGHRGIEVHIDG